MPMSASPQTSLAIPDTGPSQQHQALLTAHTELIDVIKKQHEVHTDLMKAHADLLKAHALAVATPTPGGKAKAKAKAGAKKHPTLGVVRLDYNYPPAEGDIDHPGSYGYKVIFRVIPGLTFEICQSGKFGADVERRFAEGIKYLESKGASAITGDCGFMMSFQVLARKIATKPIFMSSMCQCPAIGAAFDPGDKILILTANSASLKPQKDVLLNSCGFDVNEDRFKIVGCQNVPGFEAVARGEAVPLAIVQPGIVQLVMREIAREKNGCWNFNGVHGIATLL